MLYILPQFLRSPGGFTATTPLPTRRLPPSTSTAGPSLAVTRGKAANAPLSIHSDDDDIQEVPNVKSGKRVIRGATATGTANRKRKKDDDPEVVEDVQSEHETKKRRSRRVREGNVEESGLEEQVQEVPPPTVAKRTRGGSRKPTSRSGKGEATINGTAKVVKGKAKGKTVAVIDLDEIDIEEEDARTQVENLANVINASLRPPKHTRTKQTSQGSDNGVDDECARLREQLQQVYVRFMINRPTCISF